MSNISTPHRLRTLPATPSGDDALRVRERYLRRRSQRRRLGDRGVTAAWLTIGAVMSWLFVVGFTTFGH
jgi:hypothetical protein